MYSIRVQTTSDRELPPGDLGKGVSWDRMTELLRREVSPAAAALFAEPISDPTRGTTDWRIDAKEDPRLLSCLPPEERRAVETKLAQRRTEILAFADRLVAEGGEANASLAVALRLALEVPDPDNHIWATGGEPVLTAWGRMRGAAVAADARIIGRQKVPVPPAAPVVAAAADVTAGAAPVVAPRPIGFGWLAALLWALFVLLSGTLLYALLAACAIDLPFLNITTEACRAAPQRSAASDLEANNARLREAVREAERAIAARRSTCASQPPPVEPVVPQPSPPEPRAPDAAEAQRRVDEARGSHGRLDITLSWNGREDLDLHVYCPGGRIYYGGKTACNGTLEIDRNLNAGTAQLDPVEHTTWAGEPPSGAYRVVVKNYETHGEPSREVPFTVIVRNGEEEKVYRGTVGPKQSNEVVAFTR